jgi:hypothetical protein
MQEEATMHASLDVALNIEHELLRSREDRAKVLAELAPDLTDEGRVKAVENGLSSAMMLHYVRQKQVYVAILCPFNQQGGWHDLDRGSVAQ